MNVAMLMALNRAPEIKPHVKGALNNGGTVAEIKAALAAGDRLFAGGDRAKRKRYGRDRKWWKKRTNR